jgi:hypothetical protein
MSLVIFPRNFTVDVNGTPRAAAKAYFYEPTTTNPITIYTTNSFAVTQTNPVTASSPSGIFAAVHINPAVNPTYKIVIKDSAGTEIYTEDNIPTTAMSQAEIGGALYPRTVAEIAAGITPSSYIYPELYLDRYGAVGNGSTDDAAAFTSAIAVAVVSGGDIVLSNRNYLTSGGHQIFCAKSVRLIGAGQGATMITHSGNNVCFWFKPTDLLNTKGSGFYNVEVYGNAGAAARFVKFSDSWELTLDTVLIWDYTNVTGAAIELHNYAKWTEGSLFRNVMVRNSRCFLIATRSGLGAETDSFGFTRLENCHVTLQLANCYGIYVPAQVGLPKTLYSASIQLHAWHPAGGGNYIIFVDGTGVANLVSGRADITCDGLPTPSGADNMLVYAYNGGVIDLDGRLRANGSPQTNTAKFKAMLIQYPVDQVQTVGRRAAARFKGAQLNIGSTVTVGANTTATLMPATSCRPTAPSGCKVTWHGFNTRGHAGMAGGHHGRQSRCVLHASLRGVVRRKSSRAADTGGACRRRVLSRQWIAV